MLILIGRLVLHDAINEGDQEVSLDQGVLFREVIEGRQMKELYMAQQPLSSPCSHHFPRLLCLTWTRDSTHWSQ